MAKRTVNEIYALIREKEKNTFLDLLRGNCNDIARAYLKGMQQAYTDVIALIESSQIVK